MPENGPARAPVTPPPVASARDAVCRLLAEQAARFPDFSLADPETDTLDPRDASLAHAIYSVAVTRWLTIEAVLRTAGDREPKDLEPGVRGVLLAGAAQILFLDRVPDHAAVSEAVTWAKFHVRPGAAGIVNALLRKVIAARADIAERYDPLAHQLPLEDGRGLILAPGVLPDDPALRLCAQTGIPRALLNRWAEQFADDEAARLAQHSVCRPPIILNTRHATDPLPADLPLRAHNDAGMAVWEGSPADLGPLLDARRDIWVQDAGIAAALDPVRTLAPRRIVDLCAGQGTKTRQLRAMFPDAEILACEVDERRLNELARVFANDNAVHVRHAEGIADDIAGQADLVVLDVPCSNTGVLPRRPEAKFRANAKAFNRLRRLQRKIVAGAAPLLAPDGCILYATCSVEHAENRAVADEACETLGLTILDEQRVPPEGMPGGDPAGYRDGSYAVLLGKA